MTLTTEIKFTMKILSSSHPRAAVESRDEALLIIIGVLLLSNGSARTRVIVSGVASILFHIATVLNHSTVEGD